jgi:hypothetical protein
MTAAAPRRASFKQSDVTRALKGVANAGMEVGRVEINANGGIIIFSSENQPKVAGNSWDRALT